MKLFRRTVRPAAKTVRSAQRSTIVHVVGYFPPHLGGMEVVAQEVSRELAELGRTVEVITSNVGAKDAPALERRERYTLRRLRAVEFAHTPFMPGLLWRLWRVKRPAIFHLHLSQAYLPELVWLVSKVRRIPYVVHFHLDVQPSGRLGFLFLAYKYYVQPIIMRGAIRVVALSPEQADMVKQRYHLSDDKVTFLPNGVSQDYLDIGVKPRKPHKPLRLLFVGRLAPQKRVDRLLQAIKEVKAPVKLRIVGDGEERSTLEKLADRLQLRQVTFAGVLRGAELRKEYQQADVFVLPSEREGMPLVLFEAMAAGLPVIGADVQGIREHVAGYGVVVAKPSAETFAAAIDDFYGHRDKQFPLLSRASRDKAARYSWPLLTKQLEGVYKQIERQQAKTSWRLGRFSLMAGVAIWWLLFLGLRSRDTVPGWLTTTVGFSFLVIVPGMLTVICLRLGRMAAWGRLALSVGLSLLELMLTGLLTNTVLQWFGIRQPLSAHWLLPIMTVLLAGLLVRTWQQAAEWSFPIGVRLRAVFANRNHLLLAFFPLLFVALSVLGATSLNNGGSDLWTMIMLPAVAIFSLVMVARGNGLNDTVVATAIYLVALSLLFMTSLRGWYTTGHDIQVEYQVFELAKRHAVWQIQSFRNPYNACLSITILPTIFAKLLKLADPYIYKTLFQLLFALCPVLVYLLMRKWLNIALAFLASLYFMAFPTFFTDMPYLNRQEIAFVFFALMLYMIFQDQLKLGLRRALFLILGVGLILSHYSTTYSVIAILLLAAFTWPAILRLAAILKRLHVFPAGSSSLGAMHVAGRELKRITLSMIIIIAAGSFLWTVVLTDTGGSALKIAGQTVVAALNSFKQEGPKSNDTSYSLFSFSSLSPADELREYVKTTVGPQRQAAPGFYYPAGSYQRYAIKATGDKAQPLTGLGRFVTRLGLNVASFNFAFRQATAKLLQILVLSGALFMLFRRTYTRLLDSDYVALSLGAIIFVMLQVVLPILSVQYGLLRAFQQSLMLLGMFTVLGSIALFAWLPGRRLKIGGAAVLSCLLLLSSTGFITQAAGGYYAQLNLSNSGTYYDNYYTQPQEISAMEWLNGLAPKVHAETGRPLQLQADLFAFSRVSTYTNLFPVNDIYPALVGQSSYVYLGYDNVHQQQATVSINGDMVSYTYPLNFLDQQKNLIYSNGGAEIYR
jgi:uncharacterized membrane protein/glycosyltransferase involved in cell wall biosynthesis